jgi:hypothetical protein
LPALISTPAHNTSYQKHIILSLEDGQSCLIIDTSFHNDVHPAFWATKADMRCCAKTGASKDAPDLAPMITSMA